MIQDLVKGFTANLRAFGFISQHRLWRFFWAPALISVLLGIAIFGTDLERFREISVNGSFHSTPGNWANPYFNGLPASLEVCSC